MLEFKYITKKKLSGKMIVGVTGVVEMNDSSTEFIHYKGIPTLWCHGDFLFNEERFKEDIGFSNKIKETLGRCEAISQSEILKEIYGFTDN